jgi:pantothenate kinase
MSAQCRRGKAVALDSVDAALARAGNLLASGGRRMLGIAGPPGSGKSTLAASVVAVLGDQAVVVPMDGFHLTDEELDRLGSRMRKGAPDTFDVHGYVSLLRRLHEESDRTVYAPEFQRERDSSVAGAIAVRPEHALVITEGNYLLLDTPGWREVRRLLDDAWFLDLDENTRLERLARRHMAYGKDRDTAVEWVLGSDEANARIVAATAVRADAVLRLGVPAATTCFGDLEEDR